MTGHVPTTELTNAIILATPGTEPINITNSQDTKLVLDNVVIGSPPGQKVLLITKSSTTARRVTSFGPTWEVGGTAEVTQSVLGGPVTLVDGGSWKGSGNVYDSANRPPPGGAGSTVNSVRESVLTATKSPFNGAGANRAEMQISPKPKPHPKAGRFVSLEAAVE